ncbi:uncharacterized protein F5Z01DRAFT_245810 [Emericellopsis atlantica]|uniref:Flo11 n=1 Tax=Emericellopsis atlantica TaxID=2614577 RepID=A0A9P8CM30_9HYPO|nr:uncharacterized protein F5Z01DRAFT_245810 [Emericellopsis atlantica]KAG9252028.1 hypothetical protein F5Z01DRAFT_245810 [Emericellopsis atlantica]
MGAPSPEMARSPTSFASPRLPRSRTQSISSDRPSTIGQGLVSPPQSVSPEAAFIAASAASQIVTNDYDSHADSWYDDNGMLPSGETALVSQGALQLVNNFLDQLLFNFLQVSKATTLAALRPAVTEVLKPKLAKDAINNADEELREYLGGGDEDDFVQPQGADAAARDWDLELVWKRTRLRCMVYSSLGDMEEEDEDLYMEQENLEIGADEQISDVISPAVAILLTSVLEYMGELTLTVAGQASYHRLRTAFQKDIKDGSRHASDIGERIVVEDGDMERVALDRTLGRLWRGWKKRIRSPTPMDLGSRPYSRASLGHMRSSSTATDVLVSRTVTSDGETEVKRNSGLVERGAEGVAKNDTEASEEPKPLMATDPAEIPLPWTENDVDEIEVPGLAYNSDEDDEDVEAEDLPKRPFSFILPASLLQQSATPKKHGRSSSLPRAKRARFHAALDEANEKDTEANEEAVGQPHREADVVDGTGAPGASETAEDGQEAIGVAQTTDERTEKSKSSQAEDMGTYERAEIMTSSRVSVASSSSSNYEGRSRKSTSVSSARIVDVPAPKASGSRSPSIDAAERPPRWSSHQPRRSHSPSPVDSGRATQAADTNAGAANVTYPMRPSTDRTKNASTTSSPGSGEVFQVHTTKSHAPEPAASGTSARPYAKPSSSRAMHSNTNTIESIPEVPSKSPNRHGRQESQALSEKTISRDSEDMAFMPIQSNASQRQTHTSGSSSSSPTGRIKPVRTSEEHVPTHAESVARNFEELIQSNQTITYTLTPENMRAMDSPRSPHSSTSPKFPDSKPTTDRVRSSSTTTDYKAAPASRVAGGGNHSPIDSTGNRPTPIAVPGGGANAMGKPSTVKSPLKGTTSPVITSPAASQSPRTSPRVHSGLAREARVPADSTADFAEFIKSTGPPGESRAPAGLRASGATAAPPTMSKTESITRRVSTTNRNRYQPRDAAVEEKDDSGDLVDFLRQGPPSTRTNTRGPKHGGAPLQTATIPEARNSQASTTVTEPSIQSSANSNTVLLKNKPSPAQYNKMFDDEEDMIPKRKQRRVRDPYAIDFSDEEEDDDDLLGTPQPSARKPPVKKEESLAEFLRNYEPPPEPVRAPVVPDKVPKKKASAPSLMGRLTRGQFGRDRSDSGSAKDNGRAASKPTPAPEVRSTNYRAESASSNGPRNGHVPIQVNIPTSQSHNNAYGSSEPRVERPRVASAAGSGSGRVPMKKFVPREPVGGGSRSETADLAAFLRDSGPPPGMKEPTPAQSPPAAAEGSGFSKFLNRRKKTLA